MVSLVVRVFMWSLTFGHWVEIETSPFADCSSPIYCSGPILHMVQMAQIFTDSKSFVDLRMRHSQTEILKRFHTLIAANPSPDRLRIKKFVLNNFESENMMEQWRPPDFQAEPPILKAISNRTIRQFAEQLVAQWPHLARKLRDDAPKINAQEFTIIPIENGFIVPGGRFREYYYWDSYWIIQGLLVSGMQQTAKGIIDNYLKIVDQYGFVLNGGRIYYLNRSQPPLLTAMVHSYFIATKDYVWLAHALPLLEKELAFWLSQRTVTVDIKESTFRVASYGAQSSGPRPEAYTEDLHTAAMFDTDLREQVFTELTSGTESGWDYSSRWIFGGNGTLSGNLSLIQTTRVIPVDLNAFLCGAFNNLEQLYRLIGNRTQANVYESLAKEWTRSIQAVLWNEEDRIWYDFDAETKTHRRHFFASNLSPLWSRCYAQQRAPALADMAVDYLERNGILEYRGGVPSTLHETNEQWDFPNAWPPLQDLIVDGLARSGSTRAVNLAEMLAKRWVDVCLMGFARTGDMFEKYNAVIPGSYGGGGEYVAQKGFGWTIGVALKFISRYFTDTGA